LALCTARNLVEGARLVSPIAWIFKFFKSSHWQHQSRTLRSIDGWGWAMTSHPGYLNKFVARFQYSLRLQARDFKSWSCYWKSSAEDFAGQTAGDRIGRSCFESVCSDTTSPRKPQYRDEQHLLHRSAIARTSSQSIPPAFAKGRLLAFFPARLVRPLGCRTLGTHSPDQRATLYLGSFYFSRERIN
jgi:hypothetical protein